MHSKFNGTSVNRTRSRSPAFMRSLATIGLAMATALLTSGSSSAHDPGSPGRRPLMAVLETRSQQSVPSFQRTGGLTASVQVTRAVHTTPTAYQFAAPQAHVPVWPIGTPSFHVPSPSPAAYVPAYSYPSHYNAPIPHYAPGRESGVVILVIGFSPSPTTDSTPGIWTAGPAPMNPQSWGQAQWGHAQWGPSPGPTSHSIPFAAWPQAQQQTSR